MPKYHHCWPLRVWCISGSHCLSAFLIELGVPDGGAHDSPGAYLLALRLQLLSHIGKQGLSEFVLLQQAAKLQQRGPVRHSFTPQIDAHETAQCCPEGPLRKPRQPG